MSTMNNARFLALILAIHVGSASAVEKESSSSLRQVAADAAAFLRKKHHSTPTVDGPPTATDLPRFGGEQGNACRRAALEKFENDESIQVKKEALLAIMETDLYRTAVERCGPEIQMYDRASGLVCLLEEESSYNTTYASFWGGDNSDYGYVYYDGAYEARL